MNDITPTIDSHRPWIRDERDDPSRMDWMQTLFNPFGKTYKLHFSRAWTLMFIGRIILSLGVVFVAFVASVAGVDTKSWWALANFISLPIPTLLVPFALFTLVTEFTSFIAHFRRFTEANRSSLLAVIVLVPLMLGAAGFLVGAMGGVQQFRAAQAKAPVEITKPAGERVAGAEGAATEEISGTLETEDTSPGGQEPGGRGEGHVPKSEMEAAMRSGIRLGGLLWTLCSLPVMLWTLLYVARLPNEGIGRFRTGSDVTAKEAAAMLQA